MEYLIDHQLNIMLFLSGICTALAIMVLISRSIPEGRRNALLILEAGCALLLICDRSAYIYRGDISHTGYIMVRVCNFLVYMFSLIIIQAFNHFLIELLYPGQDENGSILLNICDFLLILGGGLTIVSQFTGIFYYFDEMNLYHRNSGIVLFWIITLTVLLIQMIVIARSKQSLSLRMRIAMLLFAFVPLTAALLQTKFYGLSLTNISIVGLAMLLYLITLLDMNATVAKANQQEIKMLRDEQELMQNLFDQTASALASAIDAKDKYTHGHSGRVAAYSESIARTYGMSEEDCRKVYYAALLHDVGKIGIADSIITKDGKLTKEEFEEIKKHPTIGSQILSNISLSKHLSEGAHFHHEKYDGTGYPEGIAEEEIPVFARIIAVADAYDAMASKRSYRDPLPQQVVREEIVKGMGTQFDPEFAKVMIHLIDIDTEYEMQEREEVKELTEDTILTCDEEHTTFSDGIPVTYNEVSIHIKSLPTEGTDPAQAAPTLVLFDSLDAKVHAAPNDKYAKERQYFEYAYINTNGESKCIGARKIRTKFLSGKYEPLGDKGREYDVYAVRFKDHTRIRIATDSYICEMIIALPDSTRYTYIGLTGESCVLTGFRIKKTGLRADDSTIERIAPEINFLVGPVGNIPNIQINGWRSAYTKGVLLNKTAQISFHTRSLPTAWLIWHCAFIVLYSSDDGTIDGADYKELAFLRLDGECWNDYDKVTNHTRIERSEDFGSWDNWIQKHKNGTDCSASIERKGNMIFTEISGGGLHIKNTTSIFDDIDDVYLTITGDQCVVTNIHLDT